MKSFILSVFILGYSTLWAQDATTFLSSNNNDLAAHALLLDLDQSHNNLISETKPTHRVYPNPTKGKATVFVEKEFSSIHLKVVNTIGQTMLTQLEVEGQYYTFDLLDLATGSYYILITIDGETQVVPVTKE